MFPGELSSDRQCMLQGPLCNVWSSPSTGRENASPFLLASLLTCPQVPICHLLLCLLQLGGKASGQDRPSGHPGPHLVTHTGTHTRSWLSSRMCGGPTGSGSGPRAGWGGHAGPGTRGQGGWPRARPREGGGAEAGLQGAPGGCSSRKKKIQR